MMMAVGGAILLAGCATAPKAPVEPHPDTPAYNWKPLFAKDLSNAELEKGAWRWEGDVLRSVLDKPIWTKADYENYVLDFEYMMEKDGNSGVFIYISNLDQFPKYKIEVQLLDDDSPKFKGKELAYQQSGSLYGRAPAVEIASKPAGEWNRMTVFCQGKNVHVVLNGKAVVDANLDDWKDPLVNPDGTSVPPWHRGFPALSTIPTRGRVGFQGVHGDAGVRIRNLRIASLGSAAGRPPMRLACQMWGVKDFWYDRPDKLAAFAEIFPKMREMGYEGVQCAAFLRVDADGLETLLNANGLAIADQPVSFEDIEDEAKTAQTVAFCRRFGIDFVYIPWYKAKTAEEWRLFCRRMDAAEARLKPYGIKVGYHHHTHELAEKVDGEYPWDILTGPGGARLEMDIGPVLDVGRVPAHELVKMKGRLPGGIHAKPVGATAAGAPGEQQEWPQIIAAAEKAGVKWIVVECEKRKNTYKDIETSAKTLIPLVSLVNELR
jgi:sugar phosphate isomerase/epimerase